MKKIDCKKCKHRLAVDVPICLFEIVRYDTRRMFWLCDKRNKLGKCEDFQKKGIFK